MKKIFIVAAMSKNRVIGKDNKLPWGKIAKDMKRFRQLTDGKFVIMGRKTYESIGQPLPNRVNIIVTKQLDYRDRVPQSCIVVSTLAGALEFAQHRNVYVIGGAEIYKQAMEAADVMFLTLVDRECEGDAYFPEFGDEWEEIRSDAVDCKEGKDKKVRCVFMTYRKKKNGKVAGKKKEEKAEVEEEKSPR